MQPLLRDVAAEAEALHVGLYVVGGYVRDRLLNYASADLDLVVEGDAIRLVAALVARYGGHMTSYPPFGTATWHLQPGLPLGFIDFATTRTETYAHPAALPTVTVLPERGALAVDVRRRDFTINTLAVQLAPLEGFGRLVDYAGGLSDSRAGLIRVLHDASFVDDPTRIFRAARFEQRFGFQIEPHTATLIAGGLHYVPYLSGERLRTEVDLIFAETHPQKAMRRLNTLGVLAVLDIGLIFDERLSSVFTNAQLFVAQPLWKLPTVDLAHVYWGIVAAGVPEPEVMVERLALNHVVARKIAETRRALAGLAEFDDATPHRTVWARLNGLSDEALIAAYALSPDDAGRAALVTYCDKLRYISPTITGTDLKNIGLKPGPRFGKLLARLRDAWLDGVVSTPEQERAYLRQMIDEYSRTDDGN